MHNPQYPEMRSTVGRVAMSIPPVGVDRFQRDPVRHDGLANGRAGDHLATRIDAVAVTGEWLVSHQRAVALRVFVPREPAFRQDHAGARLRVKGPRLEELARPDRIIQKGASFA